MATKNSLKLGWSFDDGIVVTACEWAFRGKVCLKELGYLYENFQRML